MKNVLKNFKEYSLYFGIFFMTLGLTSCSDDDDGTIDPPEPEPTGTITASDQTLSGNTLIIEDVTVGQDSWVVVRNTDNQEMVSDPVFVEGNSTEEDMRIQLNDQANLTGDADGDDFDVVLYADHTTQGTRGTFDEDVDQPITGSSRTVTTTAPSIFVDDDQMVTEEGDVTFSSVNTGATGGYIGLYGANEDGTINEDQLVGISQFIQPGQTENVTVRFNEGFDYQAGQTFYPRLFTDNPGDQQFTFETSDGTEDLPETFGFDPDTGQERFVGNTANTATPGGFTVGNTGTGTGTGTGN